MPGVNLDFLPASQAPEALGSPDSTCAESGLEEMIGDLLAQQETEDEVEPFCRRKFELTLQGAVGEIHSDLQAFGKQVDARLKEAAAQVAPLAESLLGLQEENLRLRIQQERLVRQVEALCQVMGLPDPLLHVLPSNEYSSPVPCESKTPFCDSQASSNFPTASSDPPGCTPHDTTPGCSAFKIPDSTSNASRNTSTNTSLDTSPSVPQKAISFPQDSVSTGISTPQDSEPSPVPHPPTFATRRSLSAPSLTANMSCKSEVLISVNGSHHDLLVQISYLHNGNDFYVIPVVPCVADIPFDLLFHLS